MGEGSREAGGEERDRKCRDEHPGVPPSGDKEIRERIEALRLVLLSGQGARGAAGNRGRPGQGRRAGGVLPQSSLPGRDSCQDRQPGEIENAREVSGCHGKCLLIERDVGEILGADTLGDRRLLDAYCRLLPQEPQGEPGASGRKPPEGAVFLDLETTGLSATPLFLAGALVHRGGALNAVQLLARDYSEERCLIDLLDGMLADCGLCVTFNGKSFDLPYLRERAKYHRLELRAGPEHFDLLHHARRRWKHRLPDCRLLTLEWFILGRRRMGDVGGWEVPCIYHEFVHTRDARRLKQVLTHNLMDVLSMAELMISLAEA